MWERGKGFTKGVSDIECSLLIKRRKGETRGKGGLYFEV